MSRHEKRKKIFFAPKVFSATLLADLIGDHFKQTNLFGMTMIVKII